MANPLECPTRATDDSKIVELPRSARERRLLALSRGHVGIAQERTRHGCVHHSWLVNPKERTVHCSVCGQVSEAFDVLLDLIRNQDGALWAFQDRERLHTEIERLRIERNKLRASVRGMQKRRTQK
jgi:hypothetical protein